MAVKLKKRAIFLLSLVFTGIFGLWNTFRGSNPNDSLIVGIAQADVPAGCSWCGCAYTNEQCAIYYAGDSGGDGGGCCGDASGGGGCGCCGS